MLHKNIDMAQATRLTRQGRLQEAMALLQGAAPAAPAAPEASPGRQPPIDMVAPAAGSSGVWEVAQPGPAATPESFAAPGASTRADQLDSRAGAGRGDKPSLPRSLLEKFRSMPLAGSAKQAAPAPWAAGASFDSHAHAGPDGRRDYRLYVPARAPTSAPALLLMLHGCTQSPEDFATGTGMNALAEEHGWLVVYPGQPQSANSARCWNWFNAGDQARDRGEPAILAGITRQVMSEYVVDPSRVYVAGLSAGGAAAVIMGAAYPELFAAVGVHSGLARGAATDVASAFTAMRKGSAGHAARKAGVMPTIVFHGDRDRTVHPVNGEHVLAQAGADAQLSTQVMRQTPAGRHAYTHTVRADAQGRPVLEHWLLHGAGHAWSGGSEAGSYTDPHGPDASREMIRFFSQQPGPASR